MAHNLDWVEKIKTQFGDNILSYRESAPGEPEFIVAPENALALVKTLKDLEGGGFDHLADLTGYDDYPHSPRFHVLYELISMSRKTRCSVIARIADDKNPAVPTAIGLWAGANWLERETFDMLGIHFIGHHDQRRILLPEQFVGYPLRKDFVVDYRQIYPEASLDESFDPFGNTVITKTKE